MNRALQEAVFSLPPARWALASAFIARGRMSMARGRLYRGLDDLGWVVRVASAGPLSSAARARVFETVDALRRGPDNAVIDSYRADAASEACANLFSIWGSGPHDLFRDLIVLKAASPDEKGVVLLKYVRTFDAVVAMFDLKRLMERYIFVLEPCWAGYCDPSLLMWIHPGQPVFVQCFTEEDYKFIRDIGAPLVPLRLGPADWVDAELFQAGAGREKEYDLVMVANWHRHKRHAVLFDALRQIRDRRVRVLLIGFPWGNRTADQIRQEAAAIGNPNIEVTVVEKLPANQVAEHVSRCKAFVFLSLKEGDSKALVESMFANVPAIVYDRTIGGARSRINPATGILSSDAQLPDRIRHMLDHYAEFTPREWALSHTGSAVTTRVLDAAIRSMVTSHGGAYTRGIVEKTNSPNLAYKHPEDRAAFAADYAFILSCRRTPGAEARRPAVA